MRHVLIAICLSLTFVVLCTAAYSAPCDHNQDRPSIGLVLSGGGARGAAHVGVIKVLEELNIPIDCIAGTSMGAIVGGLYASGLNSNDLEDILHGLDWADALKDSPSRQDLSFRRKQDDINFLINFELGFRNRKVRLPRGFVQGQKLNLLLRNMIAPVEGIESFDQLPIPFRSVATDLETGNMIVLGRGDLVTALKGSMSAPGVFAPVEHDGKLLVDGGISNNLPVDVVRAMGADVLIVVDIGFPLLTRDKIGSALSVTNQMFTILIRRKSDQQLNTLTLRDVALLPELGDIGSTDFHRTAEAVPLGEKEARSKQDQLSRLSLSDEMYSSYVASKVAKRGFGERKVRNITIVDNSDWSDKVLQGSLDTKTGDTLNLSMLQRDISRIYGLNTFQIVDYNVTHAEDDKVDVTIKAETKDWGPNFVKLGISLRDDFDGTSAYNFALRYTKTQVNPLGAEWRYDLQFGDRPLLQTEFYQPLNYASRYFVAPQLRFEKESVFNYDSEGNALQEFRLGNSQATLDFGRTFGQHSEVRVGVSRAKSKVTVRVGDPTIQSVSFESGAYRFRYSYDRRDSLRFTRHGNYGSIQWDGFRQSLGDDGDGDRVSYRASIAESWGDHTLLVFSRGGSNINSDGLIKDLFEVGGLFNLSGYHENELRGQHGFILGTAYYRHIGLGSSTFKTPLYVGGTLEAANVWNRSDDISASDLIAGGSIFIGLDTFIGPLYLAYGISEGGRTATYFRLGQVFD